MSGSGRRRSRPSSRTRRLSALADPAAEETFWFGKPSEPSASAMPSVQAPSDPTATVRSLGQMPIITRVNNPEDHAALIDHRLGAIYEGASVMAAALGTAAGIVAPDDQG